MTPIFKCVAARVASLLALSTAAFADDKPANDAAAVAKAGSTEIVTEIEGFSNQAYLDAAYDNCATVLNRSAKSCNCERKIIADRVSLDDKKMAYLYWTDKERFKKEYDLRVQADEKFKADFSERFSMLQATIFAACGT